MFHKYKPIRRMAGLLIFAAAAWFAPVAGAVTDQDIAAIGLGRATATNPQTADAPTAPSLAGVIGRMTLALGVVLGLMGGAVWAARRYMPKAGRVARGGAIEILASRALGGRKNLLLIKARDKTVLLGVSPQGIQFLTEIDQEPAGWNDTALQAGLSADSGAGPGAAREGF